MVCAQWCDYVEPAMFAALKNGSAGSWVYNLPAVMGAAREKMQYIAIGAWQLDFPKDHPIRRTGSE